MNLAVLKNGYAVVKPGGEQSRGYAAGEKTGDLWKAGTPDSPSPSRGLSFQCRRSTAYKPPYRRRRLQDSGCYELIGSALYDDAHPRARLRPELDHGSFGTYGPGTEKFSIGKIV